MQNESEFISPHTAHGVSLKCRLESITADKSRILLPTSEGSDHQEIASDVPCGHNILVDFKTKIEGIPETPWILSSQIAWKV